MEVELKHDGVQLRDEGHPGEQLVKTLCEGLQGHQRVGAVLEREGDRS